MDKPLPNSPADHRLLISSDQVHMSPSPALLYCLPVELISEILVLATLPFEPAQNPHSLAMITSRLRGIALNTPALWSTIEVNFQPDFDDEKLNWIRFQLERSSRCLLNIRLNRIFDNKIYDILRESFARIATFEISPAFDAITNSSFRTFAITPQLRRLTLYGVPKIPPISFEDISRLEHLSLSGATHRDAAVFVHQCPPLKSLKLSLPSFDLDNPVCRVALIDIFSRQAPSVVSLTIHTTGIEFYPEGGDPPERIIFPHLRVLEFKGPYVQVLDTVVAPALEEFKAIRHPLNSHHGEVFYGQVIIAQRGFSRFLKRHAMFLHSVAVTSNGFLCDQEKTALRNAPFPCLRKLSCTLDNEYTFQLLCGINCPVLEFFEIELIGNHGAPWWVLVEFMRQNSACLRGLYIKAKKAFCLPTMVTVPAPAISLRWPHLERFFSCGADYLLWHVEDAPCIRRLELSRPKTQIEYPEISEDSNKVRALFYIDAISNSLFGMAFSLHFYSDHQPPVS